MLVSCKFLGGINGAFRFQLVDEDFECIIEAPGKSSRWEAIINEYRKRELQVGPNLVYAAIDYSKEIHRPIEEILEYQVSVLKENYKEELKERNEFVRKLSAFF